ncbi:MAG: DUF2341 domain-containing protein, partial [Candidatus Bathyarchaeia archaeon]
QIDARIYLGKCYYGPQVADVTGDGIMEIIACNYKSIFIIDKTYRVIDGIVGLSGDVVQEGEIQNIDGIAMISGVLNYAVVQDIDGDGYSELVVSTQSGYIYAFDTPARTPNPRPRTEVQFYSEYRLGAAEYVPPPGGPAPLVYSPNPPNNAKEVPVSLSKLEFSVTDHQKDLMNITVTTNPNIGALTLTNTGNGRYTVTVNNLTYSTTYTWTITATDGTHTTTTTYTFTTQTFYPWWDTTWPYRKAITINHNKIADSQTNIPILIDITDPDLSSKAKNDGSDIAFTDVYGNKLAHEIEFYDDNSGHLIVWVKVPSLPSTDDTILYMYYGNSDAPNQQNPTAVWDTNYIVVQHLKESGTTRYDSTINNNHGTAYGGIAKAAGKIDGADFFDGVNDYIRVNNAPSLNPSSAITIELWMKLNSTGDYINLVNKGMYNQFYLRAGPSEGWIYWYVKFNDGTVKSVSGNVGWKWNTWHYLVATADTQTGTIKVYLDGVGKLSGTFPSGKALISTTNSLLISEINQRWIKGVIDEVRISNISRTQAWIQTSYNNQKNPAQFYAVGGEESRSDALLIFVDPPDEAVNIYTNPTLSAKIIDPQDNLLKIIFKERVSGSWVDIATYENVPSGTYYADATQMKNLGTTYYWSVCVYNGSVWTN